MKRFYEVAVVSIVFLLICLIYKGQPIISLNDGFSMDGVYYKGIAEQFYQGADQISGEAPFIKRPGTPYLIAVYSGISGTDLLHSAVLVNLAGMYLATVFLFIWLGFFFRQFWLKGLLTFLFMIAWYLPLRVTLYDPMATDAWGAAWFMAGMLFLPAIRKAFEGKKNWALLGNLLPFSLIVATGSLFRESNAVLFLALFFVVNPLKAFNGLSVKPFSFAELGRAFQKIRKMYFVRQTWFFFIPLIFILIAKGLASRYTTELPGEYSYIKTLFKWFYTKSLPEYLLGLFQACGPLVVLLPFYWKEIRSLLWAKQELLFLLVLAFLFGLVGGSDTERIFFESAFPVLLIWLGYAIQGFYASSRRWWLYVLCLLQTITFRLFWHLPDYPNDIRNLPIPFFGFFGEHFQYLFLYSHHGQYVLNSILFMEYIFLFLATWYILSRKSETKNRKSELK